MSEADDGAEIFSKLPRGRDPQYREVYSNASMTQLGPFDISLVFQKGTEVAPGHLATMDQVCVIFSPQQFKALVRSLTETLKGYESVFGELAIPDADIAPNRSATEIADQMKAARKKALDIRASSSAPPPLAKRSRGAPRKKAT